MSTEVKYFNVVYPNNNRTNSSTIPLIINKNFNAIGEISNLSEWDLHLNSIVLTNSELPYRNMKKDISYDSVNFTTNKTNYSVTIYDNTGYNFNLNGNTNLLLSGIDENPSSPGYYKGAVCFLQYISENNDSYQNPNNQGTGANSINYPDSYFFLHSVQQFLDFINTATTSCLSKHSSLNTASIYFYYDSATTLYNCDISGSFVSANVDLYLNAFLQRLLDGFRVNYSGIITDITNEIPYRGMTYKFNKSNSPKNQANNIWTYYSEYTVLQNLSDILSLAIICGGSMSIREQIYQNFAEQTTANQQYLQQKTILKILDFVFDGSQLNNQIIQFENIVLDKPLNVMSPQAFNFIGLEFFIIDTLGIFHPLTLGPDGTLLLKFCLKKKGI